MQTGDFRRRTAGSTKLETQSLALPFRDKALPQARADSAELVMNYLSIDAVQKGIVYQGLTAQHVCRYPGRRDGCDSETIFHRIGAGLLIAAK